MFALIEAAGWPIWFLVISSVIALAIIGERWWSLRESVVMPRNLLDRTIQDYRENKTSPQMLSRLARSSPLGQVFAAGLRNAKSPPGIIKEAIEESGRTVAIELERFLTSLGTIAVVAPLLGLFGTVIGMIEIFGAQTPQGTNPLVLAHGISIALYNTALGIAVAVPAMIFYRHFRAKVDVMLVDMEMQAIKLVEIIHGERQ
ncbi:MAG TPA: MotA/TolQ/ExbB proton channel family protein [Burkholderiales bacterium]